MNHENKITFTGTPVQIGVDVFIQCVMPIIKEVQASNSAGDSRMIQFYAGMMAALSGCIASDFGKQATLDLLRGTTDNLEKVPLQTSGMGSAH